MYVNFLNDEGRGRVRAAYGSATYARLVALKDRYDPGEPLPPDQNIEPTGTRAAYDITWLELTRSRGEPARQRAFSRMEG